MLAAVLLTLQHEGLYHCTTVAAAAAAVVASFLLFFVFLPLFFITFVSLSRKKGIALDFGPGVGVVRRRSLSSFSLSLSTSLCGLKSRVIISLSSLDMP